MGHLWADIRDYSGMDLGVAQLLAIIAPGTTDGEVYVRRVSFKHYHTAATENIKLQMEDVTRGTETYYAPNVRAPAVTTVFTFFPITYRATWGMRLFRIKATQSGTAAQCHIDDIFVDFDWLDLS